MTEAQTNSRRRGALLPTGRGLDLLIRWAREGPSSLAPPADKHDDGVRNHKRHEAILLLRRLAWGLRVSSSELDSGRGHTRDFGQLPVSLLNTLAWKARSYGYVTAGCRERVPLTPVQADTLYRLTWGATLAEIARDTGVSNPATVAGVMLRARADHGCASTAQLIACAYRNGWFPDQRELSVLLSGRMVWSLPVTYNDPYDKPPYLWEDNA